MVSSFHCSICTFHVMCPPSPPPSSVYCPLRQDHGEEHHNQSPVVSLQPEPPLPPGLPLSPPDSHSGHRHHSRARLRLSGRGVAQPVCPDQPAVPEGVWAGGVNVVQGNHCPVALQGGQVSAQGPQFCSPLRVFHCLKQLSSELPVQGTEGESHRHSVGVHGGEGEGPHSHSQYLEPLCVSSRTCPTQAQLFSQ